MPRRAATSESVPMALEVVKQLQADGGTEARGIDRSAGAPRSRWGHQKVCS